jgi:YbbR domain-containing protein
LDKLDSLVDEDVRVTLDLFGLEAGTHSLEPDADVFVGDVEVRSIQPPQLTVNITDAVTVTNNITPTSTPATSSTSSGVMSGSTLASLLMLLAAPASLLPIGLVLTRREKIR